MMTDKEGDQTSVVALLPPDSSFELFFTFDSSPISDGPNPNASINGDPFIIVLKKITIFPHTTSFGNDKPIQNSEMPFGRSFLTPDITSIENR